MFFLRDQAAPELIASFLCDLDIGYFDIVQVVEGDGFFVDAGHSVFEFALEGGGADGVGDVFLFSGGELRLIRFIHQI